MMVLVAVVALGLAVVEEFQDGLPPRFVLRGIPGRIARLRPGMTPAEAYETLGIRRPWLLGGMGASSVGEVLGHGNGRYEHYSVGASRIFLLFLRRPSGEDRLVDAAVSSGSTTIAEMPGSGW
jgi:hypothetical protein